MKKKYFIVIFIIFSIFLISIDIIQLFRFPDFQTSLNGKIPATIEKALDILIDLTKLFISFAIGILIGLFLFVKDTNKVKTQKHYVFVIITTIFSLLSIYFGHLIIVSSVEMLSNDFLSILSNSIIWPVRLQFLFLFLAIIFFLFFAFNINEE